MTLRESMMENNNQIDLKFGKKQIFRLFIPRDIYEVTK